MSCKETLIKLLKKEVKPASEIAKRAKPNGKGILKNEISKKKRRKRRKNIIAKQSKLIEEHKRCKTLEKYEDDTYSSNNEFITDYSDSDIEINISTSNKPYWTDKIEANITPSTSEHVKELPTNGVTVDTIYHTSNSCANYMFPMWEESDCRPEEEDNDFTPIDIRLEPKEFDIELPQCINCYATNHGKVLVFKHCKPVYFHGSFKLSVIYGNLNVLGHNLVPSSKEIIVYSLRGFSYLFLQNIHEGDFAKAEYVVKNELRKCGVSKSDILSIFSEWNPEDTIAICTQPNELKLPYIEKHISQKLLPATDECVIIDEKDVCDINTIMYDSKWDNIVDMVDKDSRVMICGGKGVGKSTLLKYLVNRLLAVYDKVFVIDLDPGQSEFTIPGCVSGVMVKEPIFGPSFTHLWEPERCIFVENIDITIEPDGYIKSAIELLKQCETITGVPILINNMGFTQSYGINIASTLISYTSPTMVVQMNSMQYTKNFEKDLTPETVRENIGMFGAADTLSDLSYSVFLIHSMADGLTSWQAQGRQTREMRILSYFSVVVDDSLSLTSKEVPLYKISLKHIKLICNYSDEILSKAAVFNASLVALCSLTDTNAIYNCHGWGIVRGMDEEVVVLITPVKEDILEHVTHLVIGSVTLPASVLMHEDKNVGLIPYISIGSRTTFNYIPKRSYLPRKN